MVEEEFLMQIEAMVAMNSAGRMPGVVCTWTTKNTGDAVTGKTLRPGAYFTAGMQSEEELLHEKV